jgi:predicted 2-oxoglutarate/Fe(II)-dependent dioxygenase YbiX
MSTITQDLARLLEGVERPGSFCVTGTLDIYPPGLEVLGVGAIALPLLPAQADALIAVASRAPYGRGDQTLVDTDVRRTWQIDADQVRIRGRAWSGTLAAIVARAAEGMGVRDEVSAELYKLLVYDQGAFFVGHRDTEKTAGMFATLTIILPSIYSGGALIVRHGMKEMRFDPPPGEPSEAAFAAFYADCPHEVEPVTSGCRLTLIYNLIRRGQGTAPRAPNHDAETRRLAARLRLWVDARGEGAAGEPAKLIYPLEHAYTGPGFSFAGLKGADAARAGALLAAAQASDCELNLALVSIEEEGSAEYVGRYRGSRGFRRGRRYDDDDGDDEGQAEEDFEIIEVFERAETLEDWRRPDGGDPGLGPLAFALDEVSPPDALDDLEADEVSFQEATGNEGGSFERRYRAAALVLWPGRDRLAIIAGGGLKTSLPHLDWLADRWASQGAAVGSPSWADAHALAGHMMASWRQGWPPAEAPTDAARMLAALTRLRDERRIDQFLRRISAAGGYRPGDNDAIVGALAVFDGSRGVERLAGVVAGNPAEFAGVADLARRATAAVVGGTLVWPAPDLRPLGQALLLVLPVGAVDPRPLESEAFDQDDIDDGDIDDGEFDDDGEIVGRALYSRRAAAGVTPAALVDVLIALQAIDPAQALLAVDRALALPLIYDADAVLVPTAVTLAGREGALASSRLLIDAAITHLRSRIALPLSPPADWRRESRLTCACESCADLARFLADPALEIWTLRAAQPERSHVESTIRNNRPDLHTATLKKGSPHTLICTKTQASYDRRVAQRRKDVDDLARLATAHGPV